MRDAIAVLGARHTFIKPHCPGQNGKVQRFNRTLHIAGDPLQIFRSYGDRAAALAPWFEFYSARRRHTALGGLPPTTGCHHEMAEYT